MTGNSSAGLVRLLLVATVALLTEPGSAQGERATAETTRPASHDVHITVATPAVLQEVTRNTGVTLGLNAGTLGAFLLADFKADLSTQPRGLTLPLGPQKPLIVPVYDPARNKLDIRLGSTGSTLVSIDLELDRIVRFILRQRDQIGLYALPPEQQPMLVWLEAFTYVLKFPETDEYTLCRDLTFTMGEKALKPDVLVDGLKLEHLDEVADLVIAGTDPRGDRFEHHYGLTYEHLGKRVDDALTHYLSTLKEAQGKP